MSNLFEDGDLFLPIRTKINAAAEMLKIAETDVLITAGAVTSIPVVTLTKGLLNIGEKVTIIDGTTGVSAELTLSADALVSDTALAIVSHTFTSDVPVGSGIYYKMTDLLNRIFTPTP